jgi:glutamate-1-semialdehyde 2,1-aminomutase
MSRIEEKITGSGQSLYARARRLIPGGTQLLSKRPEMFLPEQWPAYYAKASGDEIWDLDGKRYVDMSYSGIGACVLGYADPDVDRAVLSAVAAGTMSTLNCPEEVELAELLLELNPWAQRVRYARSGGEAMAMAVRIARAATGRDALAFCGYHGWHDWYLAANLGSESSLDGHLLPGLDPAGVPRGLAGTMLPFRYNRIEELEAAASARGSEIAAIVMEPIRGQAPRDGFLERVAEIARRLGAVLLFDEITSGFRLNTGGAHRLLGVDPDIAVYAKGMSNGYPMAAVVGRDSVMEAAQSSFISSTYWTERIGPVAALATIRKHRAEGVPARLQDLGRRVQESWEAAARDAKIEIEVGGIAPLSHFSFPGELAQATKTLFVQEMLERGFLASTAFYAMWAHTDAHVEAYGRAVAEVFGRLGRAIHEGSVEERLRGPVAHTGFRRLT